MPDVPAIHLRGVRVHNLKSVDVDVPLRGLTVFTGVSGSGKSSVAFDTLYAEAQRRYLQSFSISTRQLLERLDKPDADRIDNLPPAIAVAQRATPRGPRSTVGSMTEIAEYLALLFARVGRIFCKKCGQEVRPQTPTDVADVVEQMTPGTRLAVAFPDRPAAASDAEAWVKSLIEEGFVRVQVNGAVVRLGEGDPADLASQEKIWVLVDRLEAGKTARERLTDSVETAFARGRGRMALLSDGREIPFDERSICPRCDIEYPALEPRLFSFNDPLGACPVCAGTGLQPRKGDEETRRQGDKEECAACGGRRLNEAALSVRVGDKNIAELSGMTVGELSACLAKPQAAEPHVTSRVLLEQIQARLNYLKDVELGYLTISRSALTLSTGEAQRVRLTTALSSSLVNVLYVLDEPTAGLHARDVEKLLAVLRRLRAAGNTLVLVEHDATLIRAADWIVDIGPEAGEEGGTVVYQGPPAGILESTSSLTGAYLSGESRITVPARRRPLSQGRLRVVHARRNNLRDLTVELPLGVLCVVTGVSGAGKSTLVQDTLYPLLRRGRQRASSRSGAPSRAERSGPHKHGTDETEILGAGQIGDVVLMDQTPLPRSARSNPVTYLKAFDEIRKVFAETSEARVRGFGPGQLSFNQPGGRCETCEGHGSLTVDMQFLADVTVTCPDCKGTRYKKEVLDIRVRSLNIAEVLELTVREAFRFFRAQPRIERRLKLLIDVGLEYIRLGQPADTLSGGEAQRLKLAGHLAASRKPRCLFLLDEPTTGLHPADVAQLLSCFDRLLETGHSLIVVEHDLDVIKCADHVIDLGPGAGEEGGRVVAAGTPEEVAAVEESETGRWLRGVLGR